MGLIPVTVSSGIDDIIAKCFEINRTLDRAVSVLDVKFGLKITANLVHHNLAHPIIGSDFADFLSDYKNKMEDMVIYKSTFAGDKDYRSPLDIFVEYRDMLLSLRDYCYDVLEEASQRGDHMSKRVINKFIYKLIPYIDIANTLITVYSKFADTPFGVQMFDSVVDEYFELGGFDEDSD